MRTLPTLNVTAVPAASNSNFIVSELAEIAPVGITNSGVIKKNTPSVSIAIWLAVDEPDIAEEITPVGVPIEAAA